jgi:hypothetical protein
MAAYSIDGSMPSKKPFMIQGKEADVHGHMRQQQPQ